MRRKISLVVAMLLILSLATITAFAAETEEAGTQAICTHSAGTIAHNETKYQSTGSDTEHDICTIIVSCCKSCGAVISRSDPIVVGAAKHIFGAETFARGVHLGDYTGHYYVYKKTCSDCGKSVERNYPGCCTPKLCIDPQ